MADVSTDVIDKTIGSFGKYQAQMLFLIMIGSLQADYQLHSLLFIIPKLDYVCMDDGANNASNHCPCENPQYDTSEILTSVTSEWNLICDRTVLASLAQSMIQLGSLFGALVCGYLSDRFGRRRVICTVLLLSSLTVSLSAASPNIWTFIVLRFLSGFPVGGVLACCYVFIVELTGTNFRTTAFLTSMSLNIISLFTISLISSLIREWRYIQLCISAPWILTVVYFWILPESPRWLITVGKTEEAIELLTNIAKRNGLPTGHIESTVNETNKEKSKIEDDGNKRGSITDLFKTAKMGLYSVAVALMWLINSLKSYGITQYVGTLQGNLYLNTMLTGLCLTPSLVMYLLFTKYCKRVLGLVLSLLVTAMSLLLFILTPDTYKYANLSLIILALLGANTSQVQTHLFSSEIFPTIVRNSAFGLASMAARVGSFLAPFIVNIGVEWVTMTIFIALMLFESMVCCLLPETKGMPLKNTLD